MAKCTDCNGTGWFSPTMDMWDGWECSLCGGLGYAPWPMTAEEIAIENIAIEDAREEEINNGQFGGGA